MRYCLTVIFLMSVLSSLAQEKVITGDTSYWYNNNKKLLEKVDLKNLLFSKDEFNFRYKNYGQIIDITSHRGKVSGSITNYAFYIKNNSERFNESSDTLFIKELLNENEINSIIKLIEYLKINQLKTYKDIDGWSRGLHGLTHIIEYSDLKTYSYKTYWDPEFNIDIEEGEIVLRFINELESILNLKNRYQDFEKIIPKKGCYSTERSGVSCFARNCLSLNYNGSTQLPTGIGIGRYFRYISDFKLDFAINGSYKFNRDGDYDFKLRLSKYKLFFKKRIELSDFLHYNYRNTRFNFLFDNENNINHMVSYGLSINNKYSIGIGIDNFSSFSNDLGISFRSGMNIIDLDINGSATFYNQNINYQIGVYKNIRLFNQSIGLEISYEDFFNYRDVSISISTCL